MSFGGSVKLTGESEYKRALSQITQGLKEVGAQMKLTSATYDKNDKSAEALTARSNDLSSKLDLQRKRVETLEKKYNAYSEEVQKNAKHVEDLSKSYDEEKKSLERIGSELGTTSAEYKQQENAVRALEKELSKSSAAQSSSEKTLSGMRVQLINAQADCKKTERALGGIKSELEKSDDGAKKASEGFNTAGKSIDKFGNEVKNAGKETEKSSDNFRKVGDVLKGIGKAIAASAAAIGASAVASGKKVWDMAKETAAAGDTIDKASQKFGLSAKSYQEWDYVLSQSGADIESMGAGFKSLTNLVDKATSGNDAAAASFEKLGISTESLKDMSREDIFALTVKRLQEMEDTTGRAALANQLFGRSGQNLAPLLNQSAEATENLRNKANELGFVMSDEAVDASVKFTDSLDTLKRTFSGVKNSIVSDFLPGLTSITTGFSNLLAGNSKAKGEIKKGTDEIVKSLKESIPKAAEIITTIFETIGGVIIGALPELLESSQTLVTEILNSISESLPEVLPVLFDTLFSLFDSLLTDGLPNLLDSLTVVAGNLLEKFLEKFPVFLNKLIEFIGSIDLGELLQQFLGAVEKIAKMIADNLPMIVNNLMNAVINLVKSIDWQDLMSSGFKIVLSLIDGILDAIPQLVNALPDLIAAIVEFLTDPETITSLVNGGIDLIKKIVPRVPEIFASLLKAVTDIGGNIVKGFWEGIKSMANWLWEKITGFFGGIVDGILGFFGIHSPSTLFRDKVGKNLALGIGVGFESEMDTVKKDMQNAIPTDFDANMDYSINAAGQYGGNFAGGSTTNSYNQTFNVNISVERMGNDTDLNALATRFSEIIAQQVRTTEGIYA